MDADWPPLALEWPARHPDPPSACPHYCQIQHTQPQLTYAPVQQQLAPRGENPREIRNKAEKQRRDKLKQSIAELESVVPPVVAASRKIDKTGVLRLTAHYLRAHQYVFGDALGQSNQSVSSSTALAFLNFMNGFLITTTYKGIIVVVSQNVQQYLGHSELDLLGQNLLTITHEDDHRMLCEQLRPPSSFLGPNGELVVPDEPDGRRKVADALASEKRTFIVRLKRLSQRSEPSRYVTCHVEGSLRKADRACRENTRCCQMVRRARARGDNPCSSGNDVVFIGLVRPTAETFMSESEMECYRMEYRTRHSIDGEIIQCEAKISLITGYMTHEVNGVNAMNFMHRDDVRWVIIALREMYDQRRVFGESCYRLVAKNGQFIYLKTRGRLEIDSSTNAVNSFVCTNTVVDETEGMHLIGLMKKRFMMVSNNDDPLDEIQHSNNDSLLPLEDPRRLEKVILHLVTNLPTPYSGDDSPRSSSPDDSCTAPKLTIIPPKKERVISAIEKIYDVIKPLSREPTPSVKECDNQPPSFYGTNNDIPMIATPRLPMLQDVPEPVESDTIEDIVTVCSDNAVYQNLAPFEESFMKKRLVSAKQFNKISDQVLAAVQLDGQENATGLCSQAIKRPLDRESALTCKRKICDAAPKIFLPRIPSEGIFENFLDDNGIDSQLDSALNILNSIDNRAESAGVLPEILLESEFQELFGDMVADHIEESTLQDESPSI